jgi:hypothetical protein
MLLPADLLSSTLMPWAMAATALPLLFMLSGRTNFSGLNIAILLACILSMLLNMFYGILPKTPVNIRHDIHLAGILLECGLTFMLIWNISTYRTLRYIIMAAAALTAIVLTMIFLGGTTETLKIRLALSLSYGVVTILAAGAIYQQASSDMEGYITDQPAFWTGAGITFHYGLMALLLFMLPSADAKEWAATPGFSVFFTISHSIRYVLLAVAVHVGGKQELAQDS